MKRLLQQYGALHLVCKSESGTTEQFTSVRLLLRLMHEPSSEPIQMDGTDVPELLARVKAMRGANTERLAKKTLESLAHCIYKHDMFGHEALQSEHLVDGNGNALTTDATVEGMIRLLQQVQPKTDAPKRKASTCASNRLSKRQKTTTYTSNSTGVQPLHSQATRSRKRHDGQPINSEGTLFCVCSPFNLRIMLV